MTLTAALSYAERGWPVVPLHVPATKGCSCGRDCGAAGKHPRTRRGLRDASTDAATVRWWFGRDEPANVGILTGGASGIWVLDVDTHKGGAVPAGLPETLTIRTGAGGLHLYFATGTTDVQNNNSGRLGTGVDVRGEGGYVVAPPSLHASGDRYSIFLDAPIAMLPDGHPVLEAVRRPVPKAPRPPPPTTDEPMRDRVLAYIGGTLDRLASTTTSRHAEMLRAARFVGGILHYGVGEDELRALLLQAAERNGSLSAHGERSLRRAIAAGFAQGAELPITLEDRPRVVAPPAWDRDVPWPEGL